jgi:hypothetical protein
MAVYAVTFYKHLLSSDGHQFKCPQSTVRVGLARTPDRAVKAAQRRYERLEGVSNWTLFADGFDLKVIPGGYEVGSVRSRTPR